VADMYPDQVAYPYGGAILADAATGVLYVDRAFALDNEANDPPFPGTRAGLMRVYIGNGTVTDGYVADLRHVERGGVHTRSITDGEGTDVIERVAGQHEMVLAAMIRDIDGNDLLIGNPALADAVDVLVRANDLMRASRGTQAFRIDLSGLVVRVYPDAQPYPRRVMTADPTPDSGAIVRQGGVAENERGAEGGTI